MALRAGDVLGGARSVSTRELTDTSFGYVRNEATIAQECRARWGLRPANATAHRHPCSDRGDMR